MQPTRLAPARRHQVERTQPALKRADHTAILPSAEFSRLPLVSAGRAAFERRRSPAILPNDPPIRVATESPAYDRSRAEMPLAQKAVIRYNNKTVYLRRIAEC